MMTDEARTLDWLYAHDPTKLFAGIASQARQVFGISARQVHVDTTSFSVSGAYNSAGERVQESATSEAIEAESALIAITYGYSRDHREDLKQWMIALATTHDGDVPLFLQPLDGNSSDKISLLAAVMAIQKQLREANGEPGIYVADSGVGSRVEYATVERSRGQVGESRSGDFSRSESGVARRQSAVADS
jgi:transposase